MRCDWAELKNTGSTDVDVKGWGIYDSHTLHHRRQRSRGASIADIWLTPTKACQNLR